MWLQLHHGAAHGDCVSARGRERERGREISLRDFILIFMELPWCMMESNGGREKQQLFSNRRARVCIYVIFIVMLGVVDRKVGRTHPSLAIASSIWSLVKWWKQRWQQLLTAERTLSSSPHGPTPHPITSYEIHKRTVLYGFVGFSSMCAYLPSSPWHVCVCTRYG